MRKQFILGIDASFTDSKEFTRIKPFPGDATLVAAQQGHPFSEPFESMGLEQGYNASHADSFEPWCEQANAHLVIRRREELEMDPTVRQILPYTVIMKVADDGVPHPAKNLIVPYQRGATGGEARLHGNWSIGAGGHVDLKDVVYNDKSHVNLLDTIVAANMREVVDEEFAFFDASGHAVDFNARDAHFSIMHLGFIRDDTNEVGQVHLAVVNAILIPYNWTVKSREDEIIIGEPQTASLLLSEGKPYENWSQILLEEFAGVGEILDEMQQERFALSHFVVPGDTAAKISTKYHVLLTELVKINPHIAGPHEPLKVGDRIWLEPLAASQKQEELERLKNAE